MALNTEELKGNVAVLTSVLGNTPGIKGAKGDKGDTGETGPQGPAATITIGKTTTVNSDTEASVINVGTENAAILNFAIPRGKSGVVSQPDEPTDEEVCVWVDTDEEGLVVDSLGGEGLIDSISVNGIEQEIVDKNVDITVPTKISELEDDSEIPETLYALGADYAEYFEWEDGNPNNEDRRCLFVSIVYGTKKIKKAMIGDDILGITSVDASVIGNALYKDNKSYSAVGMVGVMRVKDNGACLVGDYVIPGDNGLAIPSTNNVGYKVTDRYDDNLIEVLLAHDSEMISRLKDDVKTVEEELNNAIKDKANINQIPTKTSDLINDSGFITEHQDLSDYAKKTDIPNTSDFITEEEVDEKLKGIGGGGSKPMELITTITTTEPIDKLVIKTDAEGNALNLNEVFVELLVAPVEGASGLVQCILHNHTTYGVIGYGQQVTVNATKTQYAIYHAKYNGNGIFTMESYNMGNQSTEYFNKNIMGAATVKTVSKDTETIRQVWISKYTTSVPAGTVINIYGVRV